MKSKFVILLILIALIISACGKEPPAEILPMETEPETTLPAETQPELEYMVAQINGIPAVLETLSRGDTVELVKAFDEKHYVVKLDIGYGLVEKNLVRPEGEPVFEGWTGYAYHNAELFNDYRLSGEPDQKLSYNTKVEVIEDLGWCYLVKQADTVGYMKPESLARNPLSNGENNTGGSSGKGTPSSGSESTGEDGGDIWLQASGKLTFLATIVPQEGDVSGKATVLADGTDIVLGYFDRDDQIPVVQNMVEDGRLTVYLDGLYAFVSSEYVQAEGEESYETWDGCSKYNAVFYDDPWMLGSPKDRLNTNTEITVLYELEDCYLVEVDGVTGYLAKEMVAPAEKNNSAEATPTTPSPNNGSVAKPAKPDASKPETSKPEKPETENSETPEQKPEETAPAPETKPTEGSSSEGTGSGSGNSGPEWSPPVL